MQPKLYRPKRPLFVPTHVKKALAAQGGPAALQHNGVDAEEGEFIETTVGRYRKVAWPGSNESGITPVGDRVLVLTDEAATKSGGGIDFIAEDIDKAELAAETGVLIGVGEDAFKWNSDRSRPFAGPRPTPGQRVYFERYAGGQYKGRDGKKYRLMDDKCLGGIEA
jgi:chaperonin GroES